MLTPPGIHTPVFERFSLALATGVLLALSYPPLSVPLAGCIALVPLLRRWYTEEDARRVYVDAFVAFQTTFLVAFSWPLRHELPSTALASLTGVVLIPLTMALPFTLSHVVKKRLGRMSGVLALISFSLIQEAFWLYSPVAMPGALLGNSLAAFPSVNQFADLAGVPGLSLWVMALNLLLYQAIMNPAFRPPALILVAILLLLAAGYSRYRLDQYDEPRDESIRVLVVQPAVPAANWANDDDGLRIMRMIDFTDSSLAQTGAGAALVVWPEATVPAPITDDSAAALLHRLQNWISARSIALLTGAITRSPLPVDPSVAFANSALFITPAFETSQYDKNLLVPFAERVPFESVYRGLDLLRVDAGGVAGYQPGRTQPVFSLHGVRFGVTICFESLFGYYSRNLMNEGASLGIVLSNIGWWGPEQGPAQYLAFSRLRSIETRRAFLINTVTGPSALLLPSGRIQYIGRWMEKRGEIVTVPLMDEITIYTRFGDWLLIGAVLIALWVVAQMQWHRRAAKKSSRRKPA